MVATDALQLTAMAVVFRRDRMNGTWMAHADIKKNIVGDYQTKAKLHKYRAVFQNLRPWDRDWCLTVDGDQVTLTIAKSEIYVYEIS